MPKPSEDAGNAVLRKHHDLSGSMEENEKAVRASIRKQDVIIPTEVTFKQKVENKPANGRSLKAGSGK